MVKKKLAKLLWPGMGSCFVVMAFFCAATLVEGSYQLAAAEASITLLMFLLYNRYRKIKDDKIRKYMEDASNTLESASRGESPLPTVLIAMGDGCIVWANRRFSEMTGYADAMMEQYLDDILPDFPIDWLSSGNVMYPKPVSLNGCRYRVYGTIVRGKADDGALKGALYFVDLTDLCQVRDEYIRSRPVVSIILIDNYEELTKNLTDNAISSLNAKLGDTITAWTEGFNGLLRKLERNRYLFIFEKRDLDQAVENKFSLLESIHEVTSPSGIPASLSIGLGVEGANFEEGYRFATLAIEMALSRGGDQAVIKNQYHFNFYGGSSKESDYRSEVHSRVAANSLMELIGQSGHVFIMGHKNADLDSVGGAVGIACMCRKKGKKANIVIDLENNSCPNLIEELRAEPEYREMFISGQEALLAADSHSILIVVDTNRPDRVECQPLLHTIPRVCVVDHHRRAADYIDPVAVELHETNASSTAELVTELLIYSVEKKDVLAVEAKALLAGICLDTKFFNVRTGERTFEAAATLRRMGADTTDVKMLLRNDFQETLAKYQIIKAAQLYRQEIAIAALHTGTTRILAAQAADEMLNISGINASFVLYPDEEQVIISARSVGKINVQVILEALGGGGNPATAGAQLPKTEVEDALERLMSSIDRYYEQ